MRKYGVFNHKTGLTQEYTTLEETTQALVDFIADYIIDITNRCPVTIIDINEDGSETWSNMDQELVPEKQLREQVARGVMSKYDWL